MAYYFSPRLPHSFYYPGKTTAYAPNSSRFSLNEEGKTRANNGLTRRSQPVVFLFKYSTTSRWFSSLALAFSASSSHPEQERSGNATPVAKNRCAGNKVNRVDCLVWMLHESARSFSLAAEKLEIAESGPGLAMAWIGKDVHQWHRQIAYQVAVYTLMKTAIDVEILLSHERSINSSPVRKILTQKTNLLGEDINRQLHIRHPILIEWFRMIELPLIEGFFIPLLKKWSMEYAGSGVAGIIVAMSCSAALGKLRSGRKSFHLLPQFDNVLPELMDISYDMVSVGKLHKLSIDAGFEQDFLSHFGSKVLPNNNGEELEFWIGLAQQKLSRAFRKESLISGSKTFPRKAQADGLAILGLFAYLGRRTRIFLSGTGIKDLDEPVIDFLSYLECGSLFIYPELSLVQAYQQFMEIVTDEIGWLEFYAAFQFVGSNEGRRSKQHAVQAEQEIILSTVLTTCYDVFSGFAHLNRSTRQPLDNNLFEFLVRSQSLLTICLEDFWAAYEKSSELSITETGASNPKPYRELKVLGKLSIAFEAQQKTRDLMTRTLSKSNSTSGFEMRKVTNSAVREAINFSDRGQAVQSSSWHANFIRKYSMKLSSTSSDVWMGTQLLLVDFMVALKLVMKQLRGQMISRTETKKLKTTLNDIASLVPVSILMLLPVSAVGHAAILAAIKRYMPTLIPSPYSSERLDVVKQLNRTKTMEVQPGSDIEDPASKRS